MMSTDPLHLILSHIEQLREDVREGFERLDGRLTRLEERVGKLENWRAEKDGESKAIENQDKGQRAAVNLTLNKTQATWGIVGGIVAAAALVLSALDILNIIN